MSRSLIGHIILPEVTPPLPNAADKGRLRWMFAGDLTSGVLIGSQIV